MIVGDIKIPVPWGYIAGKTWGNEGNSKVLVLHGRFDNVESFAELIPLLPQSYRYVAIDLPGHGKSSHFPKNIDCTYWDFIVAIRLVVRFVKEDTIILLGHSFGGGLLLTYTQLYPQDVSKLILIDANYYRAFETKIFKTYSKYHFEGVSNLLMKVSTGDQTRTFTYEEGLKTFLARRMYGAINKKSAEKIYNRNLLEIDDGKYKLSGDLRIKIYPYFILHANSIDLLMKMYPIHCPILSIVASRSEMPSPDRQYLAKLEKIYSKCVTKFVEGNHHVHANSPEIVAPLICDFLKPKSNL
ncbi:hypothetical protein RI129_004052 [Pyrocoelia pectoralis]|uniref:AB hydrolase-1 domain-containing protein n=1 Tax=Pyrocoelia pectoralis TaxID=417401 RepID=A0AAN7ZJ47_9COLE